MSSATSTPPSNLQSKPQSTSQSTIIPTFRYHNAPAAIDWLCQVFGFERHAVYPGPDNTISHAELTLGDGMIMLGSHKDDTYAQGYKSPAELGGYETRSGYLVVPDVEPVYDRARAAGAIILREPQSTDYGSREFSLKDLEGHSWAVGTYNPWPPQNS